MLEKIIFRNPHARYRKESFGGIIRVNDMTFLANEAAFGVFAKLVAPVGLAEFMAGLEEVPIMECFVKNHIFVIINKDEALKILKQEGKEVSI